MLLDIFMTTEQMIFKSSHEREGLMTDCFVHVTDTHYHEGPLIGWMQWEKTTKLDEVTFLSKQTKSKVVFSWQVSN